MANLPDHDTARKYIREPASQTRRRQFLHPSPISLRMWRLVELPPFSPVFYFNSLPAAQRDKTNRLRPDRHHFTEARPTISSPCSILCIRWPESECYNQDLSSTYEKEEERGSTPIEAHFVSSLFNSLFHMLTIDPGIHTRMNSLANLRTQSLNHTWLSQTVTVSTKLELWTFSREAWIPLDFWAVVRLWCWCWHR